MLCLTWNVNEQRPDPSSSLFQWVADLSAKSSIVVVALQEIEMGGGSVAIAAAKDVLNKSAQVLLLLVPLVSATIQFVNQLCGLCLGNQHPVIMQALSSVPGRVVHALREKLATQRSFQTVDPARRSLASCTVSGIKLF